MKNERTAHRVAALCVAGAVVAGLVATSQPVSGAAVGASRIGGADRYETSALVSRSTFAPGVGTVFLASGQGFADALSIGPAAGKNRAPVLLTRHGALPASVAAELDRLDPGNIVIVGGEGAVSDAVRDAARAFAPVERIAGPTRFETAALVSQRYFGVAAQDTYVASGETFPDALSAAAAGGALHAPVLLTKRDELPAATDRELERLDAKRLMVVGGSGAVSDETAARVFENAVLAAYRVAGPDRFITSAQVSASAFGHADTVYLANGSVFADALAGAPVAAANRGPVLLVSQNSLTTSVCREVARLQPAKVVALGGTGAVSDSVLDFVAKECAGLAGPAPTPTPTSTPSAPVPGVPVASGDTPPDQSIQCTDFENQRQAQDFYQYWVEKGFGDYYKLDPDGDGTPCESLPRG